MIDDNRLADKLNDYRDRKNPTEESDTSRAAELSTAVSLWYELIDLVIIFVNSFAYGYSVKLVANTDWKFWSYMVVGLAINQIVSVLSNTFKQ